MRRIFSADDEAAVCEAYLAGASGNALARARGVDPSVVYDCLKRCGISARGLSQAHRRYTLDEGVFERDTDEAAYFTGLLMADGCVMHRPHQSVVSLALQACDCALVEAFRAFLGSDQPIRTQKNDRGFSVRGGSLVSLAVSSRRLVASLESRGVVPRKSASARLCDSLAGNPHAWRGLVDGDGWLCYTSAAGRRRPIIGLTGSGAVCEQFAAFVGRLTGKSYRLGPNGNVWRVAVSCEPAVVVARELYGQGGVALDRKRLKAEEFIAAGYPRLNHDWSAVSAEQLLSLRAASASWWDVARKMGCPIGTIGALRRRLLCGGQPLKHPAAAVVGEQL